jgi:hypothetical protein
MEDSPKKSCFSIFSNVLYRKTEYDFNKKKPEFQNFQKHPSDGKLTSKTEIFGKKKLLEEFVI